MMNVRSNFPLYKLVLIPPPRECDDPLPENRCESLYNQTAAHIGGINIIIVISEAV